VVLLDDMDSETESSQLEWDHEALQLCAEASPLELKPPSAA
jgi:hypothetical protein